MIDVSLVAGRRPSLLLKTLESLKNKTDLFDLEVNCICNIDPFGGDDKAKEEVMAILHFYFKKLTVNAPIQPDFCSAVKWIWNHTTEDIVIHLEDDWVFLEDFSFLENFEFLNSRTKCVSLMTKQKNIQEGKAFHDRWNSLKSIVKTGQFKKPIFTTSPCIYDGFFLRECAQLLDLNFDPEKQFYSNVNLTLESYIRKYQNKIIRGRASSELIQDIGRDWHQKNGVIKKSIDGVSVWSD